jgi:hypothetical protein
MTLADPHPGGWIDHEVLTHAEMNIIRTELLKAIDGSGGGTYTLTAPLILAGDTVRVDEQLFINGTGELITDGDVTIQGNSELLVTSGSELTVNPGALMSVYGDAGFAGDVSLQGTVELEAGASLSIADPTAITVAAYSETLEVPMLSLPSVGEANWLADPLTNGGWLNTALSSQEIFFVLPVSAGDVITNVRVQVVGGAGAGHAGVDPSTKLRVRLYESPARGSGGGYTSLASVTDPATGAGYDARHNVTLSPAYTALTRMYLVAVRGETGGSAASGENLIERIYVDIVKNSLVSTSVYMSA